MPVWDRLDLTGESGPLGNTFLRQDGSGLAVVLPGRLGGWMTAAVYYPVLAILDQGFDALCLDSFQHVPDPSTLRDDAAAAVAAGRYQHVMLADKSLGTLAIAELILDRPDFAGASTIWLTPLQKVDRVAAALERLRTPGLVVIGSEDSHHDTGVLAKLEARSHGVLVVAGAHHGLAIDGNAAADIPRQLVDASLATPGTTAVPVLRIDAATAQPCPPPAGPP